MPPPPAPQGYPLPNSHHVVHPQQQRPTSSSPVAVQYPQQPPHLQSNQQVYPYPPPIPQPSPVYPQHIVYEQQQPQQHTPIYQSTPQAQPFYQPQPQLYAPPTPDGYQHFDGAQPNYIQQQGYLSPHQPFVAPSPPVPSPGLIASSPAQVASPAWSQHQFQQQQQLQQPQPQPLQQQQPAETYFSPLQPSPQSLPATVTPVPNTPSFPSSVPAAVPDDDAPKVVPRIKLRLAAPSAGSPGEDDMPSKGRAAAAATRHSNRRGSRPINYAEPDDDVDDFDSKRPTRSTRRTVVKDEDDEDDFEDDAQGDAEGDADGYAEGDAEGEADDTEQPIGTRRSSRAHKPPTRFHGEDDFEASMVLDSSPVTARVQPAAPPAVGNGRRSTRRRVAMDPDEEDEDAPPHINGDNDLPDAPPSAPEPEKPLSQRSRGKRRGSEDDAESFNPSESEQASSSETEAEHLDNFVEMDDGDDGDSFVSASPPRRRTTRQTRSAAAATRRSTRTRRADPDSDEEYGAKGRRLRKRESRPNYQLPPMDISAEIAAADVLNKAIAAASGPRGGRRPGPTSSFGGASRFGALGGPGMKPLPWSMKGKDFAQAMGDPDSSDSDNDLAMPNAGGAAGPAALGAGGGAPRGPGIPGPTDVPNFGRVNPKSSMADADPLGVDVNVTFDRVGGLDGRECISGG